jgi:MYXO-CTERM domain-containing protein
MNCVDGVCVAAAAVPAASNSGLVVMLAAMLAVAFVGLRTRRRE